MDQASKYLGDGSVEMRQILHPGQVLTKRLSVPSGIEELVILFKKLYTCYFGLQNKLAVGLPQWHGLISLKIRPRFQFVNQARSKKIKGK